MPRSPETSDAPPRPARRGLTKSYGRRVVVRDVDLEISQGEVVGLLGPERRRQDHDLLHGRGPGASRQRPGPPGRRGHHHPAHVPAGAGGHRLPAAGGERLPQADRRGERAAPSSRRLGLPAAEQRPRAREPARGARASRAWRSSRPTRCRAASGGGWRSAARSPRRPSFILLDEPFAGIDPIAVIDIQKIIAHLRDRGIGVLITDHNVRETLKITDRAYILRDGNVFRSGTPQRARIRPRGAPRLPRRGFPSRRTRGLSHRRKRSLRALALHQKLGLSARLSQRLILTPSLQQAIKLLPLTTLELAEVLEQEVMENPLLEEVPVEETKTERGDRAGGAGPPAAEREKADDPLKEIEVEQLLRGLLRRRRYERRMRPAEVPEVPPIENTLTESLDLYDHLLWQLRMSSLGRGAAGDRARRSSRTSTRTACCGSSSRSRGHGALAAWRRSSGRSRSCSRSTRPGSPRAT